MPATDVVTPALEDLFVDPRSLPSPSMSVLQLIRRADDPDVSMNEIAQLIESDVGLAVQVLRIANSALYSPGREITTVARALGSLGLRTVKLLALTSSLRSLIPQQHDGIDIQDLRHRMIVTAGLSRRAAQLLDPTWQEEAQVVGLLTGLGPVVLATVAPEAARVLTAAGSTWPRPEREREVLGFTTDDVSIELVIRWGLPSVFSQALRERRSPIHSTAEAGLSSAEEAEDDARTRALIDSLRLATLAEPILTGRGDADDVRQFRSAAGGLAGLDEGQADEWLVDAEQVIGDTAELLQFRVPHEVAYSELLAEAAERVASLQHALDAQLFHSDEAADVDELAKRNDELETEASTDSLTKLPNRRAFDRRLAALLGRAPGRFGLLMIDLDHFKSVNDSYGHSVGDDVLRLVGSTLRHQTRGDDFAARFGGEEFVMLLPAGTRDALVTVGDRLRDAIGKLVITLPDGSPLSITASVGGAMIDAATDPGSSRSLIEAADAQLYEAKKRGRNRTCVA